MNVTRRDFLKITGASAIGTAVMGLGLDLKPIRSYAEALRITSAKETTTVCCYCGVGCGLICHTNDKGKIINMEGDPDHPINEGALCAKGASLSQLANSKDRITTPLYRAPNSTSWKKLTWEEALGMIAQRVKKVRDTSFLAKNDKGQVLNATPGIAHIGSAALDNEELWLLQAMMRALGLVYIEHQARI